MRFHGHFDSILRYYHEVLDKVWPEASPWPRPDGDPLVLCVPPRVDALLFAFWDTETSVKSRLPPLPPSNSAQCALP